MEDTVDYILERLGKLELQLHYLEQAAQEDCIVVKRRKLHDDCIYPTKANEDDAGWDVYAIEDITLHPFVPVKVKTGLSIQMPKRYHCDVRARSGIGGKGTAVLAGLIDCPYTGELIVCLCNINQAISPQILKGERCAQLVFNKDITVLWSDAEFTETSRGSDGFGSSGRF